MVKLGIKILTPILIIILLFATFNHTIVISAFGNYCAHPRLVSNFYEATFYESAYEFSQCSNCGFSNKVIQKGYRPLPIQFSNVNFSRDSLLGIQTHLKIINHTSKTIKTIKCDLTFLDEEQNPIKCLKHSKKTHTWTVTGNIRPNTTNSCIFASFFTPKDSPLPARLIVRKAIIIFEDNTELIVSFYHYNLHDFII